MLNWLSHVLCNSDLENERDLWLATVGELLRAETVDLCAPILASCYIRKSTKATLLPS